MVNCTTKLAFQIPLKGNTASGRDSLIYLQFLNGYSPGITPALGSNVGGVGYFPGTVPELHARIACTVLSNIT